MKWAVVFVLASFSAVALADDARDGWWRRPFRVPVERPENATVRVPAKDGRPRICSIRRTVDLDVQPKGRRWASDTPDPAYIERVVPLREYELGFARVDGSSRIDAFMRFRFAPLPDGRPVRIEQPVIYYNGTGYYSEGWTPTGPDAEGFSGARFDIDEFEGIDLWLFMEQLWRIAMIAVTLPDAGEDRVYWLGHRDSYERLSKADLIACLCAMKHKDISFFLRDDCATK